jgi:hypothetical protein
MREAVRVSNDSPVLLDRFLSDAIECDVDALADGEAVFIGGGFQSRNYEKNISTLKKKKKK